MELVDCLFPFKRRIKSYDCLCHGQPGTGKTALVKYVLEQINENTTAKTFYVNCWESRTLSLVLDRLLDQANLIVSAVGYSAKMSRLKKKLGGRVCIISLDEVDKLDRKELNDILYLLKDIGKVGIVCISNTRKYVLTLDSRITSRLNFRSIDFPRYSDEELLVILKHRVDDCHALYPRTYSRKVLEKIIELADGDARIAIQTLRSVTCNAEKGYETIKEIKKKYILETLTPHHRLIVDLLRNGREISSTEFYDMYRKRAMKLGLKAKSRRSFNNYIAELNKLGYIKVERAKNRGNVRLFSLQIHCHLSPLHYQSMD